MTDVVLEYVKAYGSTPRNPQELMKFVKKRSDVPNVNYSQARRAISDYKGPKTVSNPTGPPSSKPKSSPPPKSNIQTSNKQPLNSYQQKKQQQQMQQQSYKQPNNSYNNNNYNRQQNTYNNNKQQNTYNNNSYNNNKNYNNNYNNNNSYGNNNGYHKSSSNNTYKPQQNYNNSSTNKESFQDKLNSLKSRVNQYKTNDSKNDKRGLLSSGGSNQKARDFKKKLQLTKKAREAGRNEDAIKVNINSVKNKPKFSRMVIYNVNCLANLAENQFNCEFMVEQDVIAIVQEAMKYHKSNPAVMKEISRLLCNVSKASPEFADKIANSGILDDMLNIIEEHPNECGEYALNVINSVVQNSSDPKNAAQRLIKKGAIDILENAMKDNMDNDVLCAGIAETLNIFAKVDNNNAKLMGKNKTYKTILDALKMHPNNGKLAINACELLEKIALADPRALKDMQKLGAVDIISKAMQGNPDLLPLVTSGKNALAVLAGEDDLTRALNVICNFDKYNNKILTEALGLLGNLALITDNAGYIAGKGGVNALLGLIHFKCKNQNLSPEDLQVLAEATRALGRLLGEEEIAEEFNKMKGMNHLTYMAKRFEDDEPIMNSIIDTCENLSGHETGKGMILKSNILPQLTKVLCDNVDYDVFMRKYAGLVNQLDLKDPNLVASLVDAGLLKAITNTLLTKYEDPEAVNATCDLIKNLVNLHPKYAQGIVKDGGQGLIEAIKANKDDPECLKHIFDAIAALAQADPNCVDYLNKLGLEDELKKILKQDNVQGEVEDVVKEFMNKMMNDGLTSDWDSALKDLDNLGEVIDDYDTNIEEVEVKEDDPNEKLWNDPDIVLKALQEMAGLLNDPGYAKEFVSSGQVSNILDNIQNFYDDPKIVVPGLETLVKCCQVPGVFDELEEAGVPEAVIQCMLEHPDDFAVQLAGMKLLAALATQKDDGVYESLCQPINIETALKALNGNLANPDMTMAFCDLVNNLLKDPNTAPQISQALVNEGVVNALQLALEQHKMNPDVCKRIKAALANIDNYYVDPEIGNNTGTVNPYGTITLAQLSAMSPEQLEEYLKNCEVEELCTTMKGAKDPKLVQSSAKEINRRLEGGDNETYSNVVNGNGIQDLMKQAQQNIDNNQPLGDVLDCLGTLSNDKKLKTLLGMHGLIRLLIETIRKHPQDINLLDKCCYILANLTYNNQQNMTQVVELGGVPDITRCIKQHVVVNFVCESALNVLVNLCHNSGKNKTLISRSGGAKACIESLKQHHKCLNEGDEAAVVAAFKLLANLAYEQENVKQLIKLDAVAIVMETMARNTHNKDIIEMGIVTLANLSSHTKVANIMVRLGVLDLVINVSKNYPDEIDIQKSCLGCIGNLMNDPSNAVAFIDKKGHLRIYDIMDELVFEETITVLCLKLIKILATTTDIGTTLTESGGCTAVAKLMVENKGNPGLVALGCQALCKMITTMEAAKYVSKEKIVDLLCELCSENDNWSNIEIMNELVKVVVNISSVEENAQQFARGGGVPLLKAIECHYDNAIFLGNVAMALSKLSIHPNSSKYLVKRGAVAVIINSCKSNPERRGIIARYIRTLSNFLYTQHKTNEELEKTNAYNILKQIVSKHPNFQPLQQEWQGFEKAMKMRSKKLNGNNHYSIPIRDRMNMTNVRLLSAGTLMRKYGDSGKPKKRIVKSNDDCTMLIFEDPAHKKGDKQLNMQSVQDIRTGNNHKSLKKVDPSNCFIIVTIDPNGREFYIPLECKTSIECQRWVAAIKELQHVNQTKQGQN